MILSDSLGTGCDGLKQKRVRVVDLERGRWSPECWQKGLLEGSVVGCILTVCWRAIGYSDGVTQKRVTERIGAVE
jgi:hypothetical protein